MHELVIISGKGGTGKTSLTAAFAALAKEMVLCDADVDAADLHLLMSPSVKKQTDFYGGNVASIDPERCISCGTCRNLCRFDAINLNYEVSRLECEGCGVCVDLCPAQAIDFPEKLCGEWFISETVFGPMVHARLGIAEENSGKLVTLVRQQARVLAEKHNKQLLLTDGPPGVGCPVIASVGGASAVLIVAEPTMSGFHDANRVWELCLQFGIPGILCVNKWDLNPDQADVIEVSVQKKGMSITERIPFDPLFTESMILGKTIFEHDPKSSTCRTVNRVWEQINLFLNNN